ncbi:hypothetical protein [Pseudomonas pharyngis]|uniref:hypothetical protein n=1 Tax=Pseudomonas pharyngis TaxID=2892333 RepID=UPI001F3F7BAC|nr:hypothetical protein [Pseudomonas pharyngis]
MKRIDFNPSGLNLDLIDIAHHFELMNSAMASYYNDNGASFLTRYTFSTPQQIELEYKDARREFEVTVCLTILAALEASFRLDYLVRVDRKLKDELSRAFIKIYRRNKNRVGFEDLLDAWKRHAPSSTDYVRELKGALAFRNWMAHGRYWVPQLARTHGYTDIYRLAYNIFDNFPFEK